MDDDIKNTLEGNKLNPVEVIAMLIYAGVVIYATIMFVNMLGHSDVFGSGLGSIFAQGGAYAAGATAILMPWAKRYWIAAGWQEGVSYVLWAIEIAILALNVMLAFDVARGAIDTSWVGWWVHLSPASPVMSIVTWGLLFVLSPNHRARQRQTKFNNAFTAEYQSQLLSALDTQDTKLRIQALAKKAVEQRIQKDLNLPLDVEYRNVNGNSPRVFNAEATSQQPTATDDRADPTRPSRRESQPRR